MVHPGDDLVAEGLSVRCGSQPRRWSDRFSGESRQRSYQASDLSGYRFGYAISGDSSRGEGNVGHHLPAAMLRHLIHQVERPVVIIVVPEDAYEGRAVDGDDVSILQGGGFVVTQVHLKRSGHENRSIVGLPLPTRGSKGTCPCMMEPR